jgi:hypothetical protein
MAHGEKGEKKASAAPEKRSIGKARAPHLHSKQQSRAAFIVLHST